MCADRTLRRLVLLDMCILLCFCVRRCGKSIGCCGSVCVRLSGGMLCCLTLLAALLVLFPFPLCL